MSNYLIKNHPEYYEWFKEKEFTWDRTGGDPITQGNRNPLLYKKMGVDGIKTGYLAVEKYSLASSVIKKKRRLIGVGSGFKTKKDRSRESAKLLNWGLNNFDLIEITKKNATLTELDVWLGTKNKVQTYINEDVYKTIPKARKKYIKIIVDSSSKDNLLIEFLLLPVLVSPSDHFPPQFAKSLLSPIRLGRFSHF